MSKRVNLIRSQSSTLGYEICFTEDEVGFDITHYKVYFTLKTNKEDADSAAVVNKTVTSHSDTANGETIIEFAPADTADLLGNYYYSIEYKDTENNTEDVLFEGRMTITKTTRITRD